MRRMKRLGKVWIVEDALPDQNPEILTGGDPLERVPDHRRVFVVILFERHLGCLHLVLLLVESLNHILLLDGGRGEVEDVHVVDTYGVGVSLGIPWTFVVCREPKVRVRPTLDVDDPPGLFVKFTNGTP